MNKTYVIEGVLFTRLSITEGELYYSCSSTFLENIGVITCQGQSQYYFNPNGTILIDRELRAVLTMIDKLHDFRDSNNDFLRKLNAYDK